MSPDGVPAANDRLTVCAVADLPPGEMRRVEVPNGAPIAVYNVDGTFYATADTCTHSRASLVDGDLEDDEVTCPVHWARFNVRTGEPLCFPAVERLATYRVETTDGVLVVVRENAAVTAGEDSKENVA
jgi:nitrite reductase/ring-hydroxylating ferredoxin subunit